MEKKRILVVDDEPDVTDLISYNLKARGYQPVVTNEPTASMALVREAKPDLIILDIMMPGLSGIQICRLLRADPASARIPIIFLTAKSEPNDRIEGLEAGADDYLGKPFSPKELLLRIESILRRTSAAVPPPRQLRIGEILLDTESHHVTVAGVSVDLTATEFKLLRLLMERQGRVQTRDHLLVTVWNYSAEIETRTVDTHVRRLREKLGPEAAWIETIRGVGYRIAEKKLPA